MIKLILIIAIVIFLGKYILKFLSFIIKSGFKIIAIVITILIVLAALSSKSQNFNYKKSDLTNENIQIDTSYVKLLQKQVTKTRSETQINYDDFWSNRTPKNKRVYTEDTVKINTDSLNKEIRKNWNLIKTDFNIIIESEEFKESKKEVVKNSENIVKTIGKNSATIYYNGKNYFKIGNEWFDEGWKKVNEKKIQKN